MPLSYGPIGMAREKHVPGFSIEENTVVIGNGEADFARAIDALVAWKHLDVGWIELFPRGAPVEPGTVVAVLAWHFGFWSLNACRVVYGVEESTGLSTTFGFAYGTLPPHVERGEEIFQVVLDRRTGDVLYRVRSASQPRALLAKIGRGAARAVQARFRRESAETLRRAITGR